MGLTPHILALIKMKNKNMLALNTIGLPIDSDGAFKGDAMNTIKVVGPDGLLYSMELKPARGRRRKDTRMAEAIKNWLKNESWINESLEIRERGVIAKHLIPFFGETPISEVSKNVQQYVSRREKDGAKPNTLKHELRCLKKIMCSVEGGWNLPRYATKNHPKAVDLGGLDHATAIRVIEHVKRGPSGEAYFRIGLIASLTGMRLKDVFELTERKLDRKNWTVSFYQSKVESLRAARKSNAEPLLVKIKLNKDLQNLFTKEIKPKKKLDDPFFIIPSRNGNGLSKRPRANISTAYRRAFKELGLEYSFKMLRHLFATALLRGGKANIKSIQRLMGHTKLDTTFKYLHALDEEAEEAIASLPVLGVRT